MTPHRAWFKSYASCVGIRVANGQVIYAAGVGTVEFAPVKDGRKLRPVLFSNVLHVPALNQNLLSVLTLTSKHSFRVIIDSNTMAFILDRVPHFYAAVADRVALLSGSTVVQSEAASPAQVSDYELWHRCFGHISLSRLKSLIEHKMVSDISLPSVPSAGSAPICPAWTASKHAIPSPRLPPADLSLSSLSTLTFTVCFLQPRTGTSTGSRLLMMLPASIAASSFARRVRPLMPLSNTRLGQKSSRVKLSGC